MLNAMFVVAYLVPANEVRKDGLSVTIVGGGLMKYALISGQQTVKYFAVTFVPKLLFQNHINNTFMFRHLMCNMVLYSM